MGAARDAGPDAAMLLAAGLGTRMRPLTDATPKPLIRVAGKTLIDYALDRFAQAGVTQAVVNVHYRADQMEAHLAQRPAPPRIVISDERGALLETGGGLKKALPHFGAKPFYCANTDAILVDGAREGCRALAERWDGAAMDALLLLIPIEATSGYSGKGDFDQDKDGRIALRAGARAPYVFTGLQIIAPALVAEGPDGPFSTRLLWDRAAARGRLYGAVIDGFWLHVGDPAGLEEAERRLAGRA